MLEDVRAVVAWFFQIPLGMLSVLDVPWFSGVSFVEFVIFLLLFCLLVDFFRGFLGLPNHMFGSIERGSKVTYSRRSVGKRDSVPVKSIVEDREK